MEKKFKKHIPIDTVLNNYPDNYPEKRNFHDVKLTQAKDLFYYLNTIKFKLTGKRYNPLLKGLFFYWPDQKTPAYFFNSINLGKNPWKVTFETTIPRLGKAPKFIYDIAVKQLAKENCKEIIAISRCAYNMQLHYIKTSYPKYYNVIKSKMKIKHPYQEKHITDYSQKKLLNDKIVFTLVGADFFRKGGREILNVFNKLIPHKPELQLNIVSSMNYGDYATQTTKQDMLMAMRIINKYPDNITHYSSLPNSEVIELFKRSHIGLLPTWADTYGYSVLEAQACGCPVISTNIRTLPEINNNKIGWLIDVPKDKFGNGIINTEDERMNFSKLLTDSLYNIVKEIDHQTIKIKAHEVIVS